MEARTQGPLTERAVFGPALYSFSIFPEGKPPRAVVGILHGYADHGQRYAHVMEAWAERGIGTVAIDMRGHGKAAGPRGTCARFDEFLDDAVELGRLMDDRSGGAPKFLLGHSFGALVAASLLARQGDSGYRGLLLSGIFLDLAMAAPKWKLAAGKVAARIAPRLSLPSGLGGAQMTHDAARAQAYDQDPLVFKNANARWHQEALQAQGRLRDDARRIKLPVLMVHGGADPVAMTSAARAFFDQLRVEDKTWEERPGKFHETLNETDWQDLAALMADWVIKRA